LYDQNPSFVLEKAHPMYYEDRPVPELQDPHDVLVNVKFTRICGSDVHYWTHRGIGSYVVEAPMILGHESSGIVSKIGSAVTSLKVGDRVCMEPGTPCRRCIRCKEGH
jgi:D-xylulose reductase